MEAAVLWILVLLTAAALWKMMCIRKRRERAHFLLSLDPVQDAHKIIWYMYVVEFPFLTQRALEFVTVNTLGIPGISNLQAKVGLRDSKRRAAETNILMSEMMHHHVDSDRGSYAVRRLNGIHGKHKIPNDQFVYVLCLIVVSPIDFCKRFGFRKWTDNEKQAAYVLWHDIGVRMGMTDIPEDVPAMCDYVRDYEAKNATFTETNKKLVQGMKHLALDAFPRFLQPLVETVISTMIDPAMRHAVGLDKPPPAVEWIVLSALKVLAGDCVSMFMPPRKENNAKSSIQVDWRPNPAADPDIIRHLNVNLYRPPAFEKGYKVAELGRLKPGTIGSSYGGHLLCPFSLK